MPAKETDRNFYSERVAQNSKALGVPVVSDDPNDSRHHASCGGCAGEKTSEDCPFSVRMQAYVDGLPFPPSQGDDDLTSADGRPNASDVA